MKCVVCKHGEVTSGMTTVTFERNGSVVVFREVPAGICSNCGESYVSEETAEQLLRLTDEAARSGTQIEVRQYAAA